MTSLGLVVIPHGKIKSIHNINFEIKDRTPINSREDPSFSKYFNTLWKELNI